jgi:hypothetical protein
MKKFQHVIIHQRPTQGVQPHLSDVLLGAHTGQLFRSLLCCIVLSSIGCITVDDPKMNHEVDQSVVGSNDVGPTDPEGQADAHQSEVEPTDATSSDSDLTDRDPMDSDLADMDDSGRVDAGNTNPNPSTQPSAILLRSLSAMGAKTATAHLLSVVWICGDPISIAYW